MPIKTRNLSGLYIPHGLLTLYIQQEGGIEGGLQRDMLDYADDGRVVVHPLDARQAGLAPRLLVAVHPVVPAVVVRDVQGDAEGILPNEGRVEVIRQD